jgi:precorrin-2/cobalt-factor-2 C20-methyltransferase
VRKSSIYLPDQLKQDLAALAARSGRAEADLIRLAIERLLAVADPQDGSASPVTPVQRRSGPVLIGVGLGPGDPRQVTRHAEQSLIGADRVFAVSWTERSIGRAETVVRAVAPTVAVERIVHDITADAAGRRRSLVAAADAVVAALDTLEVVVVVTLGDPTMWSVFGDLAAEITAKRPKVPVEMVSGITSFQALAAVTGTTLARPGQRMVVVDGDVPDEALHDPASTVVVYKGSPDAGPLGDRARKAGRLDRARVGELIGLPGERIDDLAHLGPGPISYLATVILPAVQDRS